MQKQRKLELGKQISFLPEPKYNPRYPINGTMAAKALRLLLTGAKVSHPHFEAVTGSWRLAAHIYILKKLGWPVTKMSVPLESEDEEGRKRNYDLYYLPIDCIDLVHNFRPNTGNPNSYWEKHGSLTALPTEIGDNLWK
jgi:hypothetical protein